MTRLDTDSIGANAEILRELAHAKVVFQLRAIEAIIIRDGPAVEWVLERHDLARQLVEESAHD